MPRYYIKPIFWNTNDYTKPSGAKAVSGYPKEHGYGHEEWNNAPNMLFTERGIRFRAFHTESLGNAPVEDYDGQIFLFMTASHDGIQQLVGVAGKATCLISDSRRSEREQLVKRLNIDQHWQDAWELEKVRDLHGENIKKFKNSWEQDLNWIPNWKSPEDYFFWPQIPVTIDPIKITGKKRLLNMFGSYTEIDSRAAIRLMASVPMSLRTDEWSYIQQDIDASFEDSNADIEDIKEASSVALTTKQALIDARIGQGKFRQSLLENWQNICAVTRCDQPQVLRASHIKPWSVCSNSERLNSRNGLLLVANLDALFDRGLISFRSNGEMMVSKTISSFTRDLLRLPKNLIRPPTSEEDAFLDYHRNHVFVEE
ncbi:HNH endonuclease [Acetobacter tropicalis]|uniref:HNH nuclease domain-containing protein n=1 Tax=Acetobacter tropicalis TaxID=104102 RepID=A0A252A0A8_9PROT|nr:HNH endonuclease signature motif containing protein [Acetobacter tropicalis]OUI80520.1 hypothetical protein HC62_17045 [Acetobacter tropicalis]